uniref:Zinc finger, CCHC-type n=1 Tax=Caenorhabditis tropicalis TaxID=1561998 RepID=A0A1I7U187_9PELO
MHARGVQFRNRSNYTNGLKEEYGKDEEGNMYRSKEEANCSRGPTLTWSMHAKPYDNKKYHGYPSPQGTFIRDAIVGCG